MGICGCTNSDCRWCRAGGLNGVECGDIGSQVAAIARRDGDDQSQTDRVLDGICESVAGLIFLSASEVFERAEACGGAKV